MATIERKYTVECRLRSILIGISSSKNRFTSFFLISLFFYVAIILVSNIQGARYNFVDTIISLKMKVASCCSPGCCCPGNTKASVGERVFPVAMYRVKACAPNTVGPTGKSPKEDKSRLYFKGPSNCIAPLSFMLMRAFAC